MRLNNLIENFFRLDVVKKNGFAKLKIKTIEDLLRHFPSRYEKIQEFQDISDVRTHEIQKGNLVSLKGKILKIENKRTRKRASLVSADFHDGANTLKLIWFNQPYISKIIKEGDALTLTGKISQNKKGELYFSNPSFSKYIEDLHGSARAVQKEKAEATQNSNYGIDIYPVYPETRGITSKWLHFAILKILKELNKSESEIRDFIPTDILKKYHLPDLKSAFFYIHNSKNLKNAEVARKRFAFEEIFLIQLNRIKNRILRNLNPSFKIDVNYSDLKRFINLFGFKLTGAQKKAIFRICEDFKKKEPMSRLLHGDVGSGKTIVAVAASYIVCQNRLQVAYLAPTEILARQHFNTFMNFFGSSVKIGLITSSICEKFPSKVSAGKSAHVSRARLLKWVKEGDIKILIGTHSLIQEKVLFKNLGLAIIDEQHRFGVSQRFKIVSKNQDEIPHLLSMSATPIPRTLALTIYGDLDLTLLDELPPNRKKIITYIVPPSERQRAYEQIREEIKTGRQAYIICPRIELKPGDEDEANGNKIKIEMKAVKDEYEKLSKNVFQELALGILHGKLNPKEKEKIMADFKNKKIDILISTSVIEVGIDVPNANCILIEGADRFGLAQLHQLRGRVMRSSYQSYCFVLSESNSLKTLKRLASLKKAENGFELAEYDLKFRGAGELSGRKQWGVSDIAMEGLVNVKMVEAARAEAFDLLREDLNLKKYPVLKEKAEIYNSVLHWE